MYFFYKSGKNATTAAAEINTVHGEDTVSVRTAQKWFSKFRSGNCDVEDAPRAGRPEVFNSDALLELVEAEPNLTVDMIAQRLNSSHGTVHRHLVQLGKVSKLGKWVPHRLSVANLQQRVNVCSQLLQRLENESFLNRIVTGDEKWVLYNNPVRKRQWLDKDETPEPTPRDGLHPKKILLSIWWDMAGIVYYELLEPNQTITADYYSHQLSNLNEALNKNRPSLVNRRKVLFHHDNARPHTARQTLGKLNELGWELMPHPPYSPDIAPCDYHLFRGLQSHMSNKNYSSKEAIKRDIEAYFGSKDKQFFEQGIKNLPKRWEDIVNNEGKYIID